MAARELVGRVRSEPRCQEAAMSVDKAVGDRHHLLRRLPLAEDHLRRALAECPMGVDRREGQVIHRREGERAKRCLRIELTAREALEERQRVGAVHAAAAAPGSCVATSPRCTLWR